MQKKTNHFAILKICKIKCKEQDVSEWFHIGREIIHKVHTNLKLNGKPIKFMLDSGATVNVIPATFIKDNKIDHLLKKGKNTEGKRSELINPVNKRKVIAL